MGEVFFFTIFAAVSVVASLGVVLLPNLFHAALSLVLVLLAGAAFFVMLAADFIAVAQVLIYAGAIVVLAVFAIMLTQRIYAPTTRVGNDQVGLSVVVVLLSAGALGWTLWHTLWPASAESAVTGSIPIIGRLLLRNFVLPFELVSVVLLVALIGGIIIAREE